MKTICEPGIIEKNTKNINSCKKWTKRKKYIYSARMMLTLPLYFYILPFFFSSSWQTHPTSPPKKKYNHPLAIIIPILRYLIKKYCVLFFRGFFQPRRRWQSQENCRETLVLLIYTNVLRTIIYTCTILYRNLCF